MSLLDIFRRARGAGDNRGREAAEAPVEEPASQSSGPLKSYGSIRGKGKPVPDDVFIEKVFGSSRR